MRSLSSVAAPTWHVFVRVQEVQRQLAEATTSLAIAPPTVDAASTAAPDNATRERTHAAAASKEPALSMDIVGKVITLSHANVTDVVLRFYPMDLELLFSSTPFVSSSSSSSSSSNTTSFSHLRPNQVLPVSVSGDTTTVPLPDEFATMNVMVEAVSGSLSCQQVRCTPVPGVLDMCRVQYCCRHTPVPMFHVTFLRSLVP